MPGRGARRGRTRGRETGRVTAVVVLLLALLVVAGAPAGNERTAPWSGGVSRITPVERALSRVAARVAGDSASVRCSSPTGWRALGARHDFDAEVTWALTPLLGTPGGTTPVGYSSLAPRTCRLLERFTEAPVERGTRICRHGSPRLRAVLGECDDWGAMLVAVHVVGHESIHLAGVVDEATADCLGMQLDALVAMQLGAAAAFARTLARDYWTEYYAAQAPAYRSPDCRGGGALDLFPADRGWPTPRRYPGVTTAALEPFARS